MTSRRRRFAVLLSIVALVLTGCASIPATTRPQAIRGAEAATEGDNEPVGPEMNLVAADVVREMVQRNADQRENYAASRQYVAREFQNKWRPSHDVVIIDDLFNTVPVKKQPKDPNDTLISVTGTKKGALRADGSFLPSKGKYQMTVRLHRGKDKQWRIVGMPNEVVTTEEAFSEAYTPVTLQFFAPQSNVTVPDPRYVPAEPASGLGARVIDALLDGPSDTIAGAVYNPLAKAQLDTNVRQSNGVLEVPLTGLSDVDTPTKKQIVTQIVMSLRQVGSNTAVRPLSDDKPILPNMQDRWTYSDINPPPHTADSDGMGIVHNQIVSLGNGKPVPGPAGAGAYNVASAALSWEAHQLAVVERTGHKKRLRIGPAKGQLAQTPIEAKSMSRPSWRPAYPGNDVANEVWTVLNGKKVVRATLTQDNTWVQQAVNSSELSGLGRISSIRLSPDGTRAALIVGGKLVVAEIVRNDETVQLRAPRIVLQPTTRATDATWLEQDTLVVANTGTDAPVVEVGVDGFKSEAYTVANLEDGADSVAAAPDGTVVASNSSGLWTTSGVNENWKPHPKSGLGITRPFFPG